MNVEELSERISALRNVVYAAEPRAFVDRVPRLQAYHFFRPFAEDVVHHASVRGLAENDAGALAGTLLDRLAERWPEVSGRDVTKLTPWSGGPPFADALIVLGRGVAKATIHGGHFLPSRTVAIYPIHHIEFTGEETADEAIVRKQDAHLNDMTRTPSPIIFCRYRLKSGLGSAKHFAVGKMSAVLSVLRDVVREGGRFEAENFERAGFLVTTEGAGAPLEVTLGGVTRTLDPEAAAALLETLTTKGLATATAS